MSQPFQALAPVNRFLTEIDYFAPLVTVASDSSSTASSSSDSSSSEPVPRARGSIEWVFEWAATETVFTITPISVEIVGSVIRLTFASEWSMVAAGSIPLKIYNDAAYTSPYSVEFNGNSNPAGGPVIQTVDFPLTGGYLIQTNTNFAGNYTAPGDNGSTGEIHVFLV